MNKREHYPFYIGVTLNEEKEMLTAIGLNKLDDLYSHIRDEDKLSEMNMENGLSHDEIKSRMTSISEKNKIHTSFIGDGLQNFKTPESTAKISKIRGLTTAYTPYQPERSQGTLQSLWIYQSLITKLTGFEAINASMYERSTCLYEAITCALRIKRKSTKVIIPESIYPGDREVLSTLSQETKVEILFVKMDKESGRVDEAHLKELLSSHDDIAAVAVAQINNLGLIENFDKLTDIVKEANVLVIALVEIMALANNGLKEPSRWGTEGVGADLLVAEAQYLTIPTNFGGPGLGVFGIRYNESNKTMVRQTSGRFIGKAKDLAGRDCLAIILSTREQHIRRDKATSNICSNQSFLASLCGAAILNRGSEGFEGSFKSAHENAQKLIKELTVFKGIDLLYSGPIFNEFILKLDYELEKLFAHASKECLQIGVDFSERFGLEGSLLKISVNDHHTAHELQEMINFFKRHFEAGSISSSIQSIASDMKRAKPFELRSFETSELDEYYQRLGKQNLSPDQGIYPLGSCTMKYNPELNEWAAGIEKFTNTHPQAPQNDVQGNLQILFEIQELFKDITGLPAVTTQPVAGAQGELVGIKMFQAYHRENGEAETRKIILIPRSAHGTNPATATMAGFETKKIDGVDYGIVILEANEFGEIDFEKCKDQIKKYNNRIAGIMITNPNTAGIFETKFSEISELIHAAGGLVYMDGANMNAIAGWVDLDALGVDAVHNNLHKTWSIPHGGGGPGDAIVAVSHRLVDFMPGIQVKKEGETYSTFKPKNSIGSFHRHFGNFAHKLRAYAYLKALGKDGIRRMSAIAVLSARYLYHELKEIYPTLPRASKDNPRMHEFILTLSDDTFDRIAKAGTPKPQAIARVGKLFLDFGFHAPTVAFPEVYGLMLEPTESYTKSELDSFCEVVKSIHNTINEYPHILQTVPHFTPIDRVDEVSANKTPVLSEDITDKLAPIIEDRIDPETLKKYSKDDLIKEILKAHEAKVG